MEEQKAERTSRETTRVERFVIEFGGWMRWTANLITALCIAFLFVLAAINGYDVSKLILRTMDAETRVRESSASEAATRATAMADALLDRKAETTSAVPHASSNGSRWRAGRPEDLYGKWAVMITGDGLAPQKMSTVLLDDERHFEFDKVAGGKETGIWEYEDGKLTFTNSKDNIRTEIRNITGVGINKKGEPVMMVAREGILELWVQQFQIYKKGKEPKKNMPKEKGKDKDSDSK